MSQSRTEVVQGANSREIILDAAESMMAGIGYQRTSISKICKVSGLPTGSVYHHFGSKAGLLAAILERGAARFFDAMPQAVDLSGSAEQNMRNYWAASADAIVANASYFFLESDLTRLGQDDPEIARLIGRTRQQALLHLGALIEPYAREVGVPDPAALAQRLVDFTVTFTRGALIAAGQDPVRLREITADLYLVLRAAIIGEAHSVQRR